MGVKPLGLGVKALGLGEFALRVGEKLPGLDVAVCLYAWIDILNRSDSLRLPSLPAHLLLF